MKRLFDMLIAAVVGCALAPVIIILSPLLWFAHQQIFFRQRRPGLHGRPFTLYKLCSMTSTRDENGVLLPDEQRLSRIGLFVRYLSLDEVPQLWNVLKGDMSLVGPRPLLVEYMDRYTPEQARRHDVRPGITGWAQVNGRNELSWKQKFALDVWYVDHASFFLDLRILWLTILRLLRPAGISNQGHATMHKFMGSDNDA